MDRLTSESRDGEETAYSYDFCGNRLKKLDKNGTEEYHYNRKNQLICHFSEKEKTAYRYDLQGNLLEAARGRGNRGIFVQCVSPADSCDNVGWKALGKSV